MVAPFRWPNEEFFFISRGGERNSWLGLSMGVILSLSPLICWRTVEIPTDTAVAAPSNVTDSAQPGSMAYPGLFGACDAESVNSLGTLIVPEGNVFDQ